MQRRKANGDSRLDHVSYRYPHAATDALHDITLHLPVGATVALVGDNGAGKTTLVKLLAGLYLPTGGRISIDGTDLSTVDPDRWRNKVSAGFQDHARFELLAREAVAREAVGSGDHIIVINNGHITETGSHHQLLAHNGLYAELFNLQARSYR